MSFGSAMAMGLLGGVQGLGTAIADNAESELENRRMIERETQRARLMEDLEIAKEDRIRERKEAEQARKAEAFREVTGKQRSAYEHDRMEGEEPIQGLYNAGYDDLSPQEKLRTLGGDARFPEAQGEYMDLLKGDALVRSKAEIEAADPGEYVPMSGGAIHNKTGERKPGFATESRVFQSGGGSGGGGGSSEKRADMKANFKKGATTIKSGKVSNETVFDNERYAKYARWLNASGRAENANSYGEWTSQGEPDGKRAVTDSAKTASSGRIYNTPQELAAAKKRGEVKSGDRVKTPRGDIIVK
jgi:hypothetical protein